jgi:large subunit ribosomal protein L35
MAGQKLKTHKGVKKRFRRTGTGKLMRNQAYKRHILTSKAKSRKRRLKKTAGVSSADHYRISALLPK